MRHKSTQKLIESMTAFLETNGVPDYVRRMWHEFMNRAERNPRYTLRAYARDLELDLGHLTRVLTGKRNLRPNTAEKVIAKLLLDEAERKNFVDSAFRSDKRRKFEPSTNEA